MGAEFHTRMGQRFFESTMPRIAEELAHLNRNLEFLVALLERRGEGPRPGGGRADAAEPRPSISTSTRRR